MWMEIIISPWSWLVLVPGVFFGLPGLVRANLKFTKRPVGQALRFGDPTVPPYIWAFFSFAWEQFKPLGFEPTAYARIDQESPAGVSIMTLLHHTTSRDRASAFCTISPKPPTKAGKSPSLFDPAVTPALNIEFSTVCENGMMVDTGDVSTAGVFSRPAGHSSWRFPRMRSVSMLYEIHRKHVATVQSPGVLTATTPTAAIEAMVDEIAMTFEQQMRMGVLRYSQESERFSFTWRGVIPATWKLVPPFKQIVERSLARESRKRFRALGLGEDFETVDYLAQFGNVRDLSQIPPLPSLGDDSVEPDSRESGEQANPVLAVDRVHSYSCPSCGALTLHGHAGPPSYCPKCGKKSQRAW